MSVSLTRRVTATTPTITTPTTTTTTTATTAKLTCRVMCMAITATVRATTCTSTTAVIPATIRASGIPTASAPTTVTTTTPTNAPHITAITAGGISGSSRTTGPTRLRRLRHNVSIVLLFVILHGVHWWLLDLAAFNEVERGAEKAHLRHDDRGDEPVDAGGLDDGLEIGTRRVSDCPACGDGDRDERLATGDRRRVPTLHLFVVRLRRGPGGDGVDCLAGDGDDGGVVVDVARGVVEADPDVTRDLLPLRLCCRVLPVSHRATDGRVDLHDRGAVRRQLMHKLHLELVVATVVDLDSALLPVGAEAVADDGELVLVLGVVGVRAPLPVVLRLGLGLGSS
jgi:hypothetical protein